MKKIFAMLFTVLIAAAFLFCGVVPQAQAAPVLTWKVVDTKLFVDKEHPDLTDKNHVKLKITIQYKNVSNDKIVTALFNKKFTVTGDIPNCKAFYKYSFTVDSSFDQVTKKELYPGQSFKHSYTLSVSKAKFKCSDKSFSSLDRFNKSLEQCGIKNRKINHSYKISQKSI